MCFNGAMAENIQEESPLTFTRIWQEYKIPILLGLGSIISIVSALIVLLKSFQSTTPITFENEASGSSVLGQTIAIDIEGAVNKTGVYQLTSGARVEDAIVAAGGLSEDADLERISSSVNRAAKLSDGAKLYIPRKGDSSGSVGGGQYTTSHMSGVASVAINSASQSQLEALAGIGPVTAQKIIDGRPYQTLEELVTRKILFQSTFDKLKDQLTL